MSAVKNTSWARPESLSLVEAVVPENARIEGRSALSLRLLYRHGITLLGVSRKGKTFRERVRKLDTRAGDVLLLLGPARTQLDDVVSWLGCLPLQERDLQVVQRHKAWISVASFALAIAAATTGMMHLPEALALVCMVMVGFNIVPLKEIYTSIEWPVIVLLGSMIPIGSALETSGGTALIAQQIIDFAAGLRADGRVDLLMVVTMTLSDVLNNTATTVIAAPIAIDIANRFERQSRSVFDGGRDRGILCLSDPDRAQEQYPDHGPRRLSLRRLLAHGPAARNHRHRSLTPDDPRGLF